MTEPFGHEKLIVYQKGMRFAVFRGASGSGPRTAPPDCGHAHRTLQGGSTCLTHFIVPLTEHLTASLARIPLTDSLNRHDSRRIATRCWGCPHQTRKDPFFRVEKCGMRSIALGAKRRDSSGWPAG
jgi:hypothetical protein